MKIVFMGTPDFAVASLDALKNAGFDIVGVVTAADNAAAQKVQRQAGQMPQHPFKGGQRIDQDARRQAPKPVAQGGKGFGRRDQRVYLHRSFLYGAPAGTHAFLPPAGGGGLTKARPSPLGRSNVPA